MPSDVAQIAQDVGEIQEDMKAGESGPGAVLTWGEEFVRGSYQRRLFAVSVGVRRFRARRR
jgi:hypothetical protein